MRTVNVKLFSFEELSEEAQKNCIKKMQNENYEHYPADMLTELFAEELNERGFPTGDIRWNLSYSQGDGVAFFGFLNWELFLEKNENIKKELSEFLPHLDEVSIEIVNNPYRSPWEFAMHFNLRISANDYHYDTSEFEEKLESILKEEADRMADSLKSLGYADIEHYSSEEYAKEILVDEGDVFLENGERFGYGN